MVKKHKVINIIIGVMMIIFLNGCVEIAGILIPGDKIKTNKNPNEEQKLIKQNTERLQEEILKLDINLKDNIIALSDLTPFEWDKVFIFDCYASPHYIYDKVGYEWDYIYKSYNQSMMQTVFLYDEKVVCTIFGQYLTDFPFDISSEKEELFIHENPEFMVIKASIGAKSFPHLSLVVKTEDE